MKHLIKEEEVLKAIAGSRLALRTITKSGNVLEASELGILTLGKYAIDNRTVSAAEYRRAFTAAIDHGVKSSEMGIIDKYGIFEPFELLPAGSSPIQTV